MTEPGFAVIDFETTGFSPAKHDRIVEIGVVHVNPEGRITGRWETLVNPGRDLGAQHVHGIRATDVLDAPTFAEVAGHLVELLRGRVIVAHNARFDIGFLIAELERAGYDGVEGAEALCTMLLAREFLPGAGRSLADCCDACGIRLEGAHRALVDAVATAELLGIFIDSGDRHTWDRAIVSALDAVWPPFPSRAPIDSVWRPRGALAEPQPKDFLARLRDRMPELAGPDEHQIYLALLDRCLLDRHLSEHETRELVRTADDLGIGRATAERLHRDYFDSLVGVAWADGVLTTDEIADLAQVAKVLSLPVETVAAALTQPPAPVAPAVVVTSAHVRLESGAHIVLTGEMERSREHWHALLEANGYVPKPAITKRVALLAAADPDSLSGKARKARDYGIPIVGEAWLREFLEA
ncbi:exonuclease domain-containing protein [Agromyces sp. NPDC058484]|uniref:exonuclease domain-containing protein n=1 Tax=Agromyces sp. NPDC058484 TaxID=3346524 RepID=UPI003652E62A